MSENRQEILINNSVKILIIRAFISKKFSRTSLVYSVRISDNYRAVGVKKGNTLIWFWAGLHSDYEKLLYRL
ncbi:ParE family toxin-like protein [Desulfonema magnum]|uniref:ParE family toxin-like protein n=1 Tax=Desulfonema magnum TaxID=45655 RepID=UPI003EC11A50